MSYQPMLTESGEIDRLEIVKRAPFRAEREWGGPNFPPKYLREAIDWLTLRAEAERREWRRDHGLADDSGPCVLISAYGRDVQGVRRSAF
jgi:hypothetical protein